MKIDDAAEGFLLPPTLIEQVREQAAAERRPVSEMLRDAVESYLHSRGKASASAPEASEALSPTEAQKRAALEAGERMIARRRLHPMPEGETIRSLIDFGRA